MKLQLIYASMKSDLNYIEKQLALAVESEHALLSEASTHLLKAGGKRIRPVFVLLGGMFGQYDLEQLKHIAVPLELIHMASLVHDDVLDNATMRRGQLTVKSKWDNRIAMYTGDYIYAKALRMATTLRNPDIHRVLATAMVEMCLGEMEQIRDFFNVDQSVRTYFLRIRRKTALLLAISCQLGAMAAGASKEHSELLYKFGYNVGMAFQIRDDLLDLLGSEKQIGKPPGSDMKQGNITLPVILALRETVIRDELLAQIAKIKESDGTASTACAIELIRGSEGIRSAEQLVEKYIHKAMLALNALPANTAKDKFADIAEFVAKRNY